VEIWLSELDGALPAGLFARSLVDGSQDRRWPLVRIEGTEQPTFAIDGAPDGPYAVEGPGGWGTLWPHSRPPYFYRQAPQPLAIQLGRPDSLYLGRESTDYRFTSEWGAERVLEGRSAVPVPVRVELDRMNMAILRFAPEDWRGKLRVAGRLEDGGVTDVVTVDPREGHLPSLRRAKPLPSLPFLVAGPGSWEAVAEMDEMPLPLRWSATSREGPSREGIADLGNLPTIERPFRLTVGGAPFPGGLSLNERMSTPVVRVALPTPGASRRVARPSPDPVDRVLVLPAGGDAYGVLVGVPPDDGGEHLVLPLPAGAARLLVSSKGGWAQVVLHPEGEGPGSETGPLLARARAAVRVHHGGGGEARFLRHEPDGRRVTGHGFEVRLPQDGNGATHLPPGTYDLVWVRPDGTEKRHPLPLVLAAGQQAVVQFDARR
jgi:hypothetical protein